jgi:hypothetical protein
MADSFTTSSVSGEPNASPPRLVLPPGARVWVAGHNGPVKKAVLDWLPQGAALPTCESSPSPKAFSRPRSGPVDAALLVPAAADEARYFARKIIPRLMPGGVIWIIRPASGEPDGDDPAFETSLMNELRQAGLSPASRARLDDAYIAIGFCRSSTD